MAVSGGMHKRPIIIGESVGRPCLMLTKPAERATDTVQNGDPSQHHLLDAPVPAPSPATLEAVETVHKSSLWGWLIVVALVAAAWYFRAAWLPWLAPLLPNSGAPSAKREPKPIPVRT